MVLGFGSKRKKTSPEPIFIRASPSLPELAQQRIPWPENLVDMEAVHAVSDEPPEREGQGTPHGASKTSFQGTRGPVPFHKPFKAGDSAPSSPQQNNLASLFGSGVPPPPSAFNGLGSSRTRAGSYPRPTRRARHAPTFNVMVKYDFLSMQFLPCFNEIFPRWLVQSKLENRHFFAFSSTRRLFLRQTHKPS